MLSRRRFLTAALAAGFGAFLAACAAAIRTVAPSARPTPSQPPATTPTPPTLSPSASPIGPSLRQRIGQMLLVGFRGLTVDEIDDELREQLVGGSVGGVVLFSVDQLTGGPRNVASPDQLTSLIDGLATLSPSPLIVSVDEEGGLVARLGPDHGFPPTTSAAELGRGHPEATRAAARAMAATLASVGVTLNLAPVVDLAVNPSNPIIAAVDRSFSADPDVVIAHASAFIEAHHEIGIRCALKHFPGQGSATGDTHRGVVDVTEVWTEAELLPFRALVGAGLADAVLTAHIFNATLDPDHPATLSSATVDGLLRADLGFERAVISDDLQMGAIRDAYGNPEAVALAIESGIDLLLVANQLVYEADVVERTIDIVEGLVRSGRIAEGRIDASVARIAALSG